MIERTFKDIPEGKVNEADQQSFLVRLGWSQGTTWDDLLRSKRILMISEAGAGKTYECHERTKYLRSVGETAFRVELAALATEELRGQLDAEEETWLDAWLSSQSDVATFFLDSLDELKLTLPSFERALKRFKKCIGNQLHRARIVVTTRPIPFDEKLVRKILPVPPTNSPELGAKTFAKIAMRDNWIKHDDNSINRSQEWRTVALMPLSDEQIVEFSRNRGVDDPDLLLDELKKHNAQEFARRPQDLIELCVDWCVHKCIRKHRDQVETNIQVKLRPSDDRDEPAELSAGRAIEGAGRLALAMQMTRRLTIRHSAKSDVVDGKAALNPEIILPDWKPNERKALLERPLFGFASYGRVRFHHGSVVEYLAAERLLTLRKQGMSFSALKRLLFLETKGKIIVCPSKRPVAGWLALQEDKVFELLRDNEPAVLLNEGDPESLTPTQRNKALRAYSDCYGRGGWRGLRVPGIQVRRFASKELAGEINRIWHSGVENPDVRAVLIDLIEAGRIDDCADIVFQVACDAEASIAERIKALDALVALDDKRLDEIVADLVANEDRWSDQMARIGIACLFPKYMSVNQLCQTLRWVKLEIDGVVNLPWKLPRIIANSRLDYSTVVELRDGIVALISEGLKRTNASSHIESDWSNLRDALAATCKCGLDVCQSGEWLYASVLSLRLYHQDSRNSESINSLQSRLENLNADSTARLFWVTDRLLRSVYEVKDPRERFYAIITHDGPIQLKSDRDLAWVSDSLGDTTLDLDKRAMLLEAALHLTPGSSTRKKHAEELKSRAGDEPVFLKRIDDWLKPSKFGRLYHLSEKQLAKQKRQEARRKAQEHEEWASFCREISNKPEEVFSSDRRWNTAWTLWRATMYMGDDSRSPSWNRRIIEELFGKKTADRLRLTLMEIWRQVQATWTSDIPEGERNNIHAHLQFKLAAIYAEAENPGWANKISDEEAHLAAGIALTKLGDLPHWMEALTVAHPREVEQMLGNKLSRELNQAPEAQGYSSAFLSKIGNAPENVARLMLPHLKAWLDEGGDRACDADNSGGMAERVRQVANIILRHGNDAAKAKLKETAFQRRGQQLPRELCQVWISTLMHIDPPAGVGVLEYLSREIEPAEESDVVVWFANLFRDSWNKVDLGDERFTPPLLLRLLRLAYRHVRIQDDSRHQGPYSLDTRDFAEQARSNIYYALLDSKGEEGWAAKLGLAADPLCLHIKDWILAVAEEKWAQETDADALDDQQAVALENNFEAPVTTNEAMFAIMKDRLSNLDDLLLRDDSPREAWAGIKAEKAMRRVIALELRHTANSIYTVDQEAVTADENETDIRLRSTTSAHEAVIEIKLGDERSAKDLRNAIKTQLAKKYMGAENRKSGALLVTLARDRKWERPDGNGLIDADELLSLLREEAERVEQALGGDVRIAVHFLKLYPRLPPEKEKDN